MNRVILEHSGNNEETRRGGMNREYVQRVLRARKMHLSKALGTNPTSLEHRKCKGPEVRSSACFRKGEIHAT